VGDSIQRRHRAGVRIAAHQHEADHSEQGNHHAYSEDDVPCSDLDVPVSQTTQWRPTVVPRTRAPTRTTARGWSCHQVIIQPARSIEPQLRRTSSLAN
jgi:hypothetical protein